MEHIFSNSLCLFFAWLFARGVVHKLSARDYYRDLVASYVPLSSAAAALLGLVIVLELTLVALLLLPGFGATGLGGSALLLGIYALFMAWRLWQGRTAMPCGCSGANSPLVLSPPLVLRNVACAIVALAAAAYAQHWGPWPQLLVAFGLALFLAAAYLLLEQLLANAQYMNEEV